MTRPDDDRLLARFNQRLTGIEAEVPTPGPWRHRPGRADRQGPGLPLHSAVRLAAAVLVIAIFGGLVVVGVLSAPTQDVAPGTDDAPDTSTTEELLAGFALDELEPGVLRVVNDGVRDLAATFDTTESFNPVDIVAGLDGSVWRIGGGELIRLGHESTHAWPDDLPAHVRDEQFMVGPDGVLWLSVPQDRPSQYGPAHSLWAFDGADWERQVVQDDVRVQLSGAAMRSDGVVHVTSASGVHRIDSSGDTMVSPVRDHGADPGPVSGADLAITADGTRWLLSHDEMTIHRDDGSGWERLDLSGLGDDFLPSTFRHSDSHPVSTAIGPEETLWVGIRGTAAGQAYGALINGPLASLDAEDPEWTARAGEYDTLNMPIGGGPLRAGAGGRVWFTPIDPNAIESCLGITELDGQNSRRYLGGLCVHTFDVAPDGTVWAVAGPIRDRASEPVSTYVIRPDLAKMQVSIEPPVTGESSVELVTEVVEPGVTRVLSDGHRDVSWPGSEAPVYDPTDPKQFPSVDSRVLVRPDGVVSVALNSLFYELGQEPTRRFPGTDFMTGDDELVVDLEGTLYKRTGWRPQSWAIGKAELWSFGSSGWSREDFDPGVVHNLTTSPTGDVWADTSEGTLRRDPTGWTEVTGPIEGVRGSTFVVTDDLTRWLLGPGPRFYVDSGEGWEQLPPVWPEALATGPNTPNVGPDGTLWVHVADAAEVAAPVLARYQAGEWSTFELPGDTPTAVGYGFSEHLEVATDGSVWFNPGSGREGSCAGLINFDGIQIERYLDDHCIYDVDTGPDGRVWVIAGPSWDDYATPGGLYIIDPRQEPRGASDG